MITYSGVIIINEGKMQVLEYPQCRAVCGEEPWSKNLDSVYKTLTNAFGITRGDMLDLIVISGVKEDCQIFAEDMIPSFIQKTSSWNIESLSSILPNYMDNLCSFNSKDHKKDALFVWFPGITDEILLQHKEKQEKPLQKKDKIENAESDHKNVSAQKNKKDSAKISIETPSELFLMMNKKTKEYEGK